jgi:hypothetical protein
MSQSELPRHADITRFAFDTVDGETVAIDTVSGSLMLLTGIGPWLWECLAAGSSVDAVLADVEARFGASASGSVRSFFEQLAEHDMLTDKPSGLSGDAAAGPAAPEPTPPAHFTPPALETFNEIADIIAMDPIHDVDPSRGWPHR